MIKNTIKTKSHFLWLALFVVVFINACIILSDDEADSVNKIDTTSPTLTNIYANSVLKQNIHGKIVFTFNENVEGFITNDIELSGANLNKGKFTANSKKKYTWEVTPMEKGKLYISIPVGSFEDLAGNTNINSISTNFAVEEDINPPTVNITGLFDLASNIRGQVIFSFSEDVTNFTKSDIKFSDPSPEIGGFRINNKKSYELIITPKVAGTLTVSIDTNSFEDLAGHSNKAISTNLVVDTSKPEVVLKEVIKKGRVPIERSTLKGIAKDVISYYTNEASPTVVAKYVKVNGTGDESSWDKATNDVKATINSILDASDSKIYLVLVASGKYPSDGIAMKNHVAIIGGWDPNADWERKGVTRFDGQGSHESVFVNIENNLDHTALLYSATITNGNANSGGGMYNKQSSPSLFNVNFLGNKATDGGGMYNKQSSPSLHNVVFSGNSVTRGGGMYNEQSSPILVNATFSGNTATSGGGMYNEQSSPILVNATFSGNTATSGGGMYNEQSSPILVNATFSGNTADTSGGGIYVENSSNSLLVNTIFWSNLVNGIANQISFSGATEKLSLHYSIIQGGTSNLSKFLTSSYTTNSDPLLSPLDENNAFVQTHALGSGSSAINKGVYVKKLGNNFYFSKDNQNWYTEFDNNGLKTTATIPNNAENITATDARGYKRVKQPDIGAYEYEATPTP